MVESPKSEASHDSGAAIGKNHALKDKQCQYCHQHFTSSSLGRHLDQFIFRKKPDGVHDVEEIRRLRGGITRRTTKGGASAKQDREGSQSTPHTISPVYHDPPAVEVRADLNATPVEGYRIRLNEPNWQATGVINGLPGSATLSPALENVTSTTGKRSYSSIETAVAKDILGLRGDPGSAKDTARALELALREVLDLIQAAHVKSKSAPSPFSIDIQSHTFPSLVLHLLPSPPTLLTSSTPFATPDSFPLSSPPDHIHLSLLRSTIISLTATWKSDLLHSASAQNYTSANSYASQIDASASTHIGLALKHLNLAYEHYTSLPKAQQVEIWQIELARAFASEKQKRAEVEASLEAAMAETRQLSGQVDRLSRCQWPREMALWPPDRKPIRRCLIKEMENGPTRPTKRRRMTPGTAAPADGHHSDPDDDEDDEDDKRWDYDTLLSKWKKIVHEDTLRKRGLSLPVPYTPPTLNTPLTAAAITSAAGPSITTSHTHLSSSTSATVPAPTPSSSAAAPPTTTTVPRPSTTTSSKKKQDTHHHPFEPWSKKPDFVNGEDCMIGIPVSEKRQSHGPRHGPGQRGSNLRDLVGEHQDEGRGDGEEREGGYASGNVRSNENGNGSSIVNGNGNG